MPDIVDDANEIAAEHLRRHLAAAIQPVPSGEPGECSECGDASPRLVAGRCAPCRDAAALRLKRFGA